MSTTAAPKTEAKGYAAFSNEDLFMHFYYVSASLQRVLRDAGAKHGDDPTKWCAECNKGAERCVFVLAVLSEEIERRNIGLNSMDSTPPDASASLH